MSKFVDILGTEIEEGDFVAIGQRSGNSGALSVAIVLETLVNEKAYSDYDKYKIRVLGSYKKYTGGFQANTRHGDTYPDRVIVINESVPRELWEVLTDANEKYWNKKT